MKLIDYLKARPTLERREFASRCETSLGHLQNIGYGYKPCGEALAIAIERETGGQVTVEELRPDVDWAVIRRGAPAGGEGRPAA